MMRGVYVRDLACYQKLPEQERIKARLKGDTMFAVPDGLKEEMAGTLLDYIRSRGETLSLDSMRAQLWAFNTLVRFLSERFPDLERIGDEDLCVMERSLKSWMVKNGYALTGKHNRLNMDEAEIRKSPLLCELERIFRYCEQKTDTLETSKDVWEIDKLPFKIRQNPSRRVKTIRFTQIVQKEIREEVKHAFQVTGRYLSCDSLRGQLRAMKRLSIFLADSAPSITSLVMLDREIIEEYLTSLNTGKIGKKSMRSELSALNSLLSSAALILDAPHLKELFFHGDLSERGRIRGYRSYDDEELKMWNDAIRALPEQVARAMVIHELLGNRISETLTLKSDCLCMRGGYLKARVFQVKTQRTVYKPANETVKGLIERSISYTAEHYGPRQYIFVSDKDPEKPMSYGTIQYQMMKLVRQKQLRNENGELYGVGTHAFRHTMGKKLTQLHVDDETIAQLLGHSGLGSIDRYRKFGSKVLAEETRQVRARKDELIGEIMKEW